MTAQVLLDQLGEQQQSLVEIVRQAGEPEYRMHYHPDLSPLGWHLGHCVYTEIYWLHEVILGEGPESASMKSYYVPELSPKIERGPRLPPHSELCQWAEQVHQKNLELFGELIYQEYNHKLMDNLFLINFLIQHYAQHNETIHYILTQRRLRASEPYIVNAALRPAEHTPEKILVNRDCYEIGSAEKHLSYDNERPAHRISQQEFFISSCPVTNEVYLAFMESGGYENKKYWSEDGWSWKLKNSVSCPDHWQKDPAGNWYGHSDKGPGDLEAKTPVYGLSYYEAAAFARWTGARLAHEMEWEIACREGKLSDTGIVWEWCGNTFFPYKGFEAYPYEGYSVPYFDNNHFTLKGGSRHTHAVIKRPSFRNYFEADKRHQYAGIRLAWG